MKKKNCVIALGGGAFVNKNIRENVLKNAISIWLTLDIETLINRTQWNEQRPLLNKVSNKKKLNELFEERKNFYKLANHKIVCDELSRNDIVEKIMTLYAKY